MLNATERLVEGLEALGPSMHKGGWFTARNQNSSRSGSISAGTVGNNSKSMVGAWFMREKGTLKG
jgi:hypothetical protein